MAHAGEKLAEFLKKSASKIEELQVQTALGKAEVSDKLEEVKKDALKQIHQLKADANAFTDRNKEKLNRLKAKLEHLELQLALGKAETKEEWAKQRKKIAEAFHEVSSLISKN